MHHHFLSILVSVLAGTVSALPNNSPSSSCKLYTDNFENLTPVLVGGSVGVNNGVTYQAFSPRTKDPATGSTGGVIPHSASQDIVAAINQDAEQLGSVTINPFGNIVAYPSKAFDLYSFWFGCSANAMQAAASTSIACTLSVIGFNSAGQELPVVTFSYSPNIPTANPMVLAVLPDSYRGLKNVTLGLAGAAPTVTGLWVDDVTHCNYS